MLNDLHDVLTETAEPEMAECMGQRRTPYSVANAADNPASRVFRGGSDCERASA